MKTQSVLKVFKSGKYEYIYVYYKLGVNLIRINTGNKYIKSYMTADLFYTGRMEDYVDLNQKTKDLKWKVDRYISKKLDYFNPKVSQKECESFIDGTWDDPKSSSSKSYTNKNKTLLEHYEGFYEFKQKELNNKPSVKDYLSLKNAITDYQDKKGIILKCDSINSIDFLVDFREFLSLKHEGGITRGELNDNTINKRFTCLKTFMKYIESKELFIFKRTLYDYKLQKYDNDIIALSKEDIQEILSKVIENPNWQKIIDLFVFNCFCGLRYSDLIKLKPANYIKDEDGDYYIMQENQKTEFKVQISLQQTSLNILKKYDFKLPTFCSQYFNRELKLILKHYKLFGDVVTKKRRSLKENKDFDKLRNDLISSHTCRRTFITLAVNSNVPLNNIMAASGHTKLQTVKKYLKLSQNKKAFLAIDL